MSVAAIDRPEPVRLPVLTMPATRAGCSAVPRPCPFERCRYHLAPERTRGRSPATDDSCARVLVYGDGDTTKPLLNLGFSIPVFSASPTYLQPLYRLLSQGGRQINRWGVTDFVAARVAGDHAY